MKPMLVSGRKFDIRVFAVSVLHAESGTLRGYYYEEGYLRTSCKEYDPDNFSNKYVHLTNDAIQKGSNDYGRFESSNKLSYTDFDKIVHKETGKSFMNDILP
mmetsp:Transcript_20578/g.14809  ORF Transcript_20578/g.14809 Transcript_20578/m.14809 type:complete len:102 (-) Transcript_20578:304-609(-)